MGTPLEIKDYSIVAQSAGNQAAQVVAALVQVGVIDSTASAENALDFLQDCIAKRAIKFTQDAADLYGVAAPAPRGGGGGSWKKGPAPAGAQDRDPNRKASDKQVDFALKLGANKTRADLANMTMDEMKVLIDTLKAQEQF